ncbi:MAG: hypothetical protein NW223_05865 [Hyphomicrobiaceae bacterium]|nr:hypothetical protein [Hyphomicrobiaceae bacterium]
MAVAMAEAEERARLGAEQGARRALSPAAGPEAPVRGWEALKHALRSLVERPHAAGHDAASPA